MLYSRFPLAIYFTHGSIFMLNLISQFIQHSPSACFHMSILYICVSLPALELGSSTILLFSHSVMSVSLRPHGMQHTRLPCHLPSPRDAQTHSCPLSGAIQPSRPLSSHSPPAFNLSQHHSNDLL